MSLRVLLVDDEPRVLAAMQRLMRARRGDFLPSVAVGGTAALSMLADDPFDVVISDIRMPGMDGAEFLAQTRDRHPGVMRLILSGQTETDAALRAASLAHQFLSKPCASEELFALLGRARTALARLASPESRAAVVGIGALPCAPEACARLEELLHLGELGPAEIAEVIASDVAMSTKVLQLVNSAFFGRARSVRDPSEAAALLGPPLVRELMSRVDVFPAGNGADNLPIRATFTERVGLLTRVAVGHCDAVAAHTDGDLGEALLGLWGIAA